MYWDIIIVIPMSPVDDDLVQQYHLHYCLFMLLSWLTAHTWYINMLEFYFSTLDYY